MLELGIELMVMAGTDLASEASPGVENGGVGSSGEWALLVGGEGVGDDTLVWKSSFGVLEKVGSSICRNECLLTEVSPPSHVSRDESQFQGSPFPYLRWGTLCPTISCTENSGKTYCMGTFSPPPPIVYM